jgi:hypothetical protein
MNNAVVWYCPQNQLPLSHTAAKQDTVKAEKVQTERQRQ